MAALQAVLPIRGLNESDKLQRKEEILEILDRAGITKEVMKYARKMGDEIRKATNSHHLHTGGMVTK